MILYVDQVILYAKQTFYCVETINPVFETNNPVHGAYPVLEAMETRCTSDPESKRTNSVEQIITYVKQTILNVHRNSQQMCQLTTAWTTKWHDAWTTISIAMQTDSWQRGRRTWRRMRRSNLASPLTATPLMGGSPCQNDRNVLLISSVP